jgi:hypothetical protein
LFLTFPVSPLKGNFVDSFSEAMFEVKKKTEKRKRVKRFMRKCEYIERKRELCL